jgi:hypothetical protein
MTRPPITEQLVAEAKQARDQFLAEVQALVDEHGPRVLGRVMIEVAMHPVPGMASFLNYFLLRNFMDLLPQEFRPVYEAQLELEREALAELLDAMEMGVMPSPSMLH